MTSKDLDTILNSLDKKRRHKRDIQLAEARAKIDAINESYEAYYDGVHDAVKAMKELLASQPEAKT